MPNGGVQVVVPGNPAGRKALVTLDRVSVAFHTANGLKTVLRGISLTVDPGEWLAVTGRNGSGKTTLARVMAGLSGTSKGRVERLGRVQLVFQNPDAQIVGETLAEDISFGLDNLGVPQEERPERIARALRLADLDVPLSRTVETLSGGQKQRLCIASALAVGAPVLVFDESTAMLDPARRRRLLTTARTLCDEGHAVVWITQRLEELGAADRVVALDNGAVTHDGGVGAFFDGPCQRLGFPLPYVVAVAKALERRGIAADPGARPVSGCGERQAWMSADGLAQAVVRLCR